MIWELRHKHKISLLIEVSGLPRSTYYYYAKSRVNSDKYSEIKEQITSIYAQNKGRYGYRDTIEHFKVELIDYLDYYNNSRIKAKLKGLPPAVHRRQALQID